MDKNRVIGNRGEMPWVIPSELSYFKEVTQNTSVVMGRKTFETIGKVLDERENIIVTTDKNYKVPRCKVANSLAEAFSMATKEIFVIGGASIYKQAIPFVDRFYITEIEKEFEGDTTFPEVDLEPFEKKEIKRVTSGIPYTCFVYERKIK